MLNCIGGKSCTTIHATIYCTGEGVKASYEMLVVHPQQHTNELAASGVLLRAGTPECRNAGMPEIENRNTKP